MHTRYRPARDALFATLSDGAVVLDIQTKKYFSLNDTGARVWALIREGLSVEEIISMLLDEYDVSRTAACEAVTSLVESLAAENLIEPDGVGS
ncbi:MAG TPA: PqqD family peptide modification chaperone [Gemmatimonadaceae bacterium]|nr:PqqD family peptide modification chaperone [Gemmatimonadaceae bacterium]